MSRILFVLGIVCIVLGIGALIVAMNMAGPREIAIGAGIGLIVVGVVLWIISSVMKKGWREAIGMSPAAGSRVGNYLADVVEHRSVREFPYEVFYQTPVKGKNGRPSLLIVRVPVAAHPKLKFNPKTRRDRLGQWLSISRAIRTGDDEFDDAIYIRGLDGDYARQLLDVPEKRSAIVALVNSGFREVRLTGETIEAEWMSFDPEKDDRPGLADDAGETLAVLARGMPAVDPAAPAIVDWSYRWCVVLWILLILYAATVGFCFLFPPLRSGDLIMAALAEFPFGFGVMIALATLLLRGTTQSHDRWYHMVWLGGILVAVGSVGTVAGVNGFFDDNPPVDRTEIIVNKRTHTNKGSTSYYASVADWDHPGEVLEFHVSAGEYQRAAIGRSKMRLVVGPGHWKIAWLKQQAFLK